MDRTGKFVVGACFAFLIAWMYWMQRAYPPVAKLGGTNAVSRVGGTNAAGTNLAASVSPGVVGTNAAAIPAISALPSGTLPVPVAPRPASEERVEVIENEAIRVSVTSHGGGVRLVELKRYLEDVGCGPGKRYATTNLAALNRGAAMPAFVLGAGVEGDGEYVLSRMTNGGGIRAEKRMTNGLVVVKEYAFGTNQYLVAVRARVENRGASAVTVPEEWSVGTATPVNSHDNAELVAVHEYDGAKVRSTAGWVSTPGIFCIPSKPRQEHRSEGSSVVWGAVNNQFFALIVRPDAAAGHMVSHRVVLPARGGADPQAVANPTGVQSSMHFGAVNLAPGQTHERGFTVFAGPKEYFTLSRLEPKLDGVMDYSGFSGFFAKILLLSMNALHRIGMGYGWCIIAITVIIKMLFWPMTAASTRSMKRMGELQPQIKVLQEKYKDDPKKMNEKMLLLWREHKINPAAGCLPLIVQIPVFFGLFTMLRSAIELRGAEFLWMCDLSAPDTLFIVPGLGLPFNLMPLIYIATALWQTHLTPVSPQMDPVQQKMLRYMPLMFLVIFYNYSCGLALYWTVQNLLTILQMKLTTNAGKSTPPAPAVAAPAKRK